MLKESSYEGYWKLRCDSETVSSRCSTGIKTMLETLSKLPEILPELFPIPPMAIKFEKVRNEVEDNLLVFTSANSDEEIGKSADAIRSNADFPFIMLYLKKKGPDSMDKRIQYQHTPNGELYQLVTKCNSAGSCWKLISMKTKPIDVFEEVLPSKVTNRDRIHLPANEEDFERATNEKGGKWMLHCSNWEELDNLWKNLIRLYALGILVGLKSCTPKLPIKEIAPEYQTKAIMCYTADADCKSSVKRAAQSIFICTGYDSEFYYKSNEASLLGRYCHEGFKGVSKYKFTKGGEMFERDHLKRWKIVILNEQKH